MQTLSGFNKIKFVCSECGFTCKTSGLPFSCPKCNFNPTNIKYDTNSPYMEIKIIGKSKTLEIKQTIIAIKPDFDIKEYSK